MKTFLAIALLAGTAAWAADPVPLDVKPGEWEYTVTSQMSGMMPAGAPKQMPQIPPEQLAKMPPDVRARVEAQMKQAQAVMNGQPTTNTSKSCIKKEDLAKLNPGNTGNQNCKTTITSSSSRKLEMKMECTDNNKMTGTILVEATSSDTIKFNLDMAGTNNGQPMTMKTNGTGKWLGATCTENK